MSTERVPTFLRLVGRNVLSACLVATAISLAFIDAPVEAQFTPTPEPTGYRGSTQTYHGVFSDLAIEIDRYWAAVFRDAGISYASPNIFVVERETETPCGLVVPQPNAFYCRFDRTVYLIPQFLVDLEREFGDYAPITVFSHEWGHHIQALLGIQGPTPRDFELQADCLMGVFTRHADESGLLDYGDFMEALDTSETAGDPPFLPEDHPEAHGKPEDRIKALTKGYGGGIIHGCELPIGGVAPIGVPSLGASSTATRSPTQPHQAFIWPDPLPLDHRYCFRMEADHPALSFDDLAARFGGIPEARGRLLDWGWSSGANRIYACDTPPSGEAGWIDINLDLFETAAAASAAVDYFAFVRAEGTWLAFVSPPAIGDHAVALSGPASNGKEFTVYASQGPLLIRVTGVSPTGIPFNNVLTVAQSVLVANQVDAQPPMPVPESAPQPERAASSYLPSSLALTHADCFGVFDRGAYSYNDVVDALQQMGVARAQIDGLGWIDGAYVVFTCEDPPFGRASQVDIVVHQFQAAAEAQTYFDSMYEPGPNGSRACDHAQLVVVCVFALSDTGSPLSDVHFVLNQVFSGAR